MALFPALRQDTATVTAAATKISSLVTLDAKVKMIVCLPAGPVWLGSSTVTTTDGLDLVSGDKVVMSVDGPGADGFYFVSAVNQTMKVEQYG